MEIDLLKLYRGNDIKITDGIVIHVPLLKEVEEMGEKNYFSLVLGMCSVGADMKWQLDDMDIDYTQIEDYDLFIYFISKTISHKYSKYIFGDELNFSTMTVERDEDLDEDVLVYNYQVDEEIEVEIGNKFRKFISNYIPYFKKTEKHIISNDKKIVINRLVYENIVEVLRTFNFLKRNDEIPGNELTRMVFIDEARENYEMQKDEPYESQLMPLVSAMVNSEGFPRDDQTVFDMNIYAFMDSVKRISKIKNAELLLQSGYSGFGVNLKDINKDQIDWLS